MNRIVDPLPEGHVRIGDTVYRTTFDWRELQDIAARTGTNPTACALVPVEA